MANGLGEGPNVLTVNERNIRFSPARTASGTLVFLASYGKGLRLFAHGPGTERRWSYFRRKRRPPPTVK